MQGGRWESWTELKQIEGEVVPVWKGQKAYIWQLRRRGGWILRGERGTLEWIPGKVCGILR